MYDIKISRIEEFSNTNTGSFLQTPFWGEFKAHHGWKFIRLGLRIATTGDKAECYSLEGGLQEVSILVRSFAKGAFSLAYMPLFPGQWLPVCDASAASAGSAENVAGDECRPDSFCLEFSHLLYDLALALKGFLPENTICVRFDPAFEFTSPGDRDLFNSGVRTISFADRLNVKKTAVDIQPPDTTRVDLTAGEDEILNRMKSKWRYNINLARRKGVKIEKVLGNSLNLSEKVDIFYDLYKITSERDGIAMHAKSYYEDLLRNSAAEIADGKDSPRVSLYIASHEGDALGAIITLFSRTEAVYLYGCSSNVKRNLMPNFLLQWTAMQDAKAYGSSYYDMYGMPPTDDEHHPMHGLYLFKTGFGGKNIHRPGTYDVPLKGIYGLATFAENARAWWHKKFLKKIRGR